MELINSVFLLRRKKGECKKDKRQKGKVWKMSIEGIKKKKEITKPPCLNAGKQRRDSTAHTLVLQSQVGTQSDWHIGMLNCRCTELLPLLLLGVNKRGKQKLFLHKNILILTHFQWSFNQCEQMLLFPSALIRVSGKASWTALCLLGKL